MDLTKTKPYDKVTKGESLIILWPTKIDFVPDIIYSFENNRSM